MISTKTAPMNACRSIRDNINPNSKITKESDLHSEKHLSPKISIDEGRMISIKPVLINASFSIRD
jgi:hypothetical protein